MTMASAIRSTTFLRTVGLGLLVIVICGDVNSDLIVKPKDSEAVVGGVAFFSCSTTLSSTEIHWFHYAVGDTKHRSFVYGYDQFYSPYLGRFQMERNTATGAYNLIITSVTVDDAGRYECQDDTGRGHKDSAQLTVLDENPVCQSNMKPHGLIGPNICGIQPEELHLTCAVQYHGNQPPIMQWKDVGSDNPIGGVTQNISSNRAIYYLKMEVNSQMDGSSYQCQTTRSATSQYGCTSDIVNVVGFDRSSAIAVIIVVVVCIIIITAVIVGWIVLKIQQRRQMKLTGSANNPQYQPLSIVTEHVKLKEVQDKEIVENLRTDNKRLTEKLTELEKLLYSKDNTRYRTTSDSAQMIKTKAAESGNAPVTGMAILGKNLFVVSKKYPDVEVYDAETFIFERFIQTKEITNPLDIASSKEIQCLYVINRQNDQSESQIIKVSIAGGAGKYWRTENDDGRLSTYESNLIVCFSTKRIIIEYSPEGQTVNTVRLSPGAGFDQLWHAIKLTGTNFAVSHSKKNDRQRVCVVDINGSVLMAFEELPTFMFRMDIPICLAGDRDKSMFVADTNNNRVLLLNLNLKFEGVLLETKHIPTRLCLNESKNRIFIGVNCGKKIQEAWRDGHILIYNIKK